MRKCVSIALDERLKKKLDAVAAIDNVSRSRLVENILLEYFLKQKPKFW